MDFKKKLCLITFLGTSNLSFERDFFKVIVQLEIASSYGLSHGEKVH